MAATIFIGKRAHLKCEKVTALGDVQGDYCFVLFIFLSELLDAAQNPEETFVGNAAELHVDVAILTVATLEVSSAKSDKLIDVCCFDKVCNIAAIYRRNNRIKAVADNVDHCSNVVASDRLIGVLRSQNIGGESPLLEAAANRVLLPLRQHEANSIGTIEIVAEALCVSDDVTRTHRQELLLVERTNAGDDGGNLGNLSFSFLMFLSVFSGQYTRNSTDLEFEWC